MTDGLWDNFTGVKDGNGRGGKARNATEKVCSDDGKGGVDSGVSDEEGA